MVPKGFGNKKNIESMLASLETAKKCWKMPFFLAVLSQVLVFWRNFLISKKKVYREDLFNFGGRNMKDNIKKFTGLTSTHPEMGRSYTFFSSFLSKNLKNTNFGKKIIVKVGFLTLVQ